jgi:hypothetical protein
MASLHILLRILATLSVTAGTDLSVEKNCDDGSSPYAEDGQPNLECEIDGCTVLEPICWSERIDHCYDVSGSANGKCVLRDKGCDSGLSCTGLWLSCVGEWSCQDSHWWGCGKGTCTESAG